MPRRLCSNRAPTGTTQVSSSRYYKADAREAEATLLRYAQPETKSADRAANVTEADVVTAAGLDGDDVNEKALAVPRSGLGSVRPNDTERTLSQAARDQQAST